MLNATLAAVIVSGAAIIGSGALFLLGAKADKLAVWILSFAIGTLTGGALLHMLPEALAVHSSNLVMQLFLAGIVLFIVLERVIRWRHMHLHDPGHHPDLSTAQMILWGDALHNVIDGIVIGVTFRTSTELGVVASLAIFAHEVPQEIGDFGVLLGTGMPRRRALVLNYISALTVVPGAIAAWYASAVLHRLAGWLIPVAAGGFVYIALADLVPTLHHARGRWAAGAQIGLIILGIALINVLCHMPGHH